MAKQNQQKQTERRVMTSRERLGLRVSEMINSPSAQLNRRVTIHRLDTDEDQAWEEVLELLGETDGLQRRRHRDAAVGAAGGGRPGGRGGGVEGAVAGVRGDAGSLLITVVLARARSRASP